MSYQQSMIERQRYANFVLTSWDYRVVVQVINQRARPKSTQIFCPFLYMERKPNTKGTPENATHQPAKRLSSNDIRNSEIDASCIQDLASPFPLLCRWGIQLRMASPEVDEQCVFTPKCRCASWLLATDMSVASLSQAGFVSGHMTVQVSLCVLTSEWRLIHADRTVQTRLVASRRSAMFMNEVFWPTHLAMFELLSSLSLAVSEAGGVRFPVVESGSKSAEFHVERYLPSGMFMLFTCCCSRYRLRSE